MDNTVRKYAMCVSVGIFVFFQAATAQDAEKQEVEAKDLLMRGVSIAQLCDYTVEKRSYDKSGNLLTKTIDSSESKVAKSLSLFLLFKSGRYLIDMNEEKAPRKTGADAPVITFEPRPENERIKGGKGMDGYINEALNRLTGTVIIDPTTGSIAEASGILPQEYWAEAGFKIIALDFRYLQQARPERWLPQTLTGTFKYQTVDPPDKKWKWVMVWKALPVYYFHKEFTVNFQCGT